MPVKQRYLCAVLPAIALAASVTFAPNAAADGADTEIANLKAQGYTVQINWPNGFDTEPLSVCTVTAINNPNSSPQPISATTLYVDVTCPNHEDD
jgi:hypothetical protein